MLRVHVVTVVLLLTTCIQVSMEQKVGNGYYNHIFYLNGGNNKDAFKMVVLNGPQHTGPTGLKESLEPPSEPNASIAELLAEEQLIQTYPTTPEATFVEQLKTSTKTEASYILPNPGIIRDNSDQLLELLTRHIVERLQNKYSTTRKPSTKSYISTTSKPQTMTESPTPSIEPSTTTEVAQSTTPAIEESETTTTPSGKTTEDSFELLVKRLQQRLLPELQQQIQPQLQKQIYPQPQQQPELQPEPEPEPQQTTTTKPISNEILEVEQYIEQNEPMETPSNQANAEQQFELLFNRLLAVKSSSIESIAPETIGIEQFATEPRMSADQQPKNDDQYFEFLLSRLQERLQPQSQHPQIQYTTTAKPITTVAPEVEQSTTPATEQNNPVPMPSNQYQPPDNDDQYVEYLLQRLQERLQPQHSKKPVSTEAPTTTPKTEQRTPTSSSTILTTTTEAQMSSTTTMEPSTPKSTPPLLTTTEAPEIPQTTTPAAVQTTRKPTPAVLSTTKAPVLSTTTSMQPLLPDPDINPDNTDQLFEFLTKRFQDQLRVQYSDWLAPSKTKKVLDNELHMNLDPVESKPFENLDNMIETNDLQADLPELRQKEKSQDIPISIEELHKNLVPEANQPLDNLDNKLEIIDLPADLPMMDKEKSQDTPAIIDELSKNLVPVASQPFEILDNKLETNDLQAGLPAIHDKEKLQETPIIIEDLQTNLFPVERSRPLDNLDVKLETKDMHSDLPMIDHKEKPQDLPTIIDELSKNPVPAASKIPFDNLDNKLEANDMNADLPAIHHQEKSQDTPTIIDDLHTNLVPVASKQLDNLDNKLETTHLHSDLQVKHYKENSQDKPIIINDLHKNLVPVARSRSFVNPDNILETNELRADLLAKNHKEKLQDTPIIINLQPYNDLDLPVMIQNPLPGIIDSSDLHTDVLVKHLAEKTNKIPIVVDLQQISEPKFNVLPKKTTKLIEKLPPNYSVQSTIGNAAKKPVLKALAVNKPIQRHAFDDIKKKSHTDYIAPFYVPTKSDIKESDVFSFEDNIKDYFYDSLDNPKIPEPFLPKRISPELQLQTHNSGVEAALKSVNNQYFNSPYRRPVPVLPSLSKPNLPLRPETHKPTVFSSLDYAGDGFIASAPGVIATSINHEPDELEVVSIEKEQYWKPYLPNGFNRPTYNLPPSQQIGNGGYYIAEKRKPLLDKPVNRYDGSRIISVNSGETLNDYWA